MSAEWPFPGDNALARARRIALAYREHLKVTDPELCVAVDDMMRKWGQEWIAPDAYTYEPGDALTTAQAAVLVSVRTTTIRQWACSPHPADPSRPLLPRFGRQGRQTTYLIEHVQAAASIMEHEKANRSRGSALTTVS